QQIYDPRAIAVDPSSHDILLLAEENAKHKIVQRISSAGVLGARYTDTADKLKPTFNGFANSLAVSPSGVAYTLTGEVVPGSTKTRAWQLPANLSSLEEVPGFAAAAEKEAWPLGLQTRVEPSLGGPQLAISTDGSTLYWKEWRKFSEEKAAGDLNIRGYSLSEGKTTSVWGGGTSRCKITTSTAALATTTGGNLAVFDFGAPTAKVTDTPAYGLKVITFGPSGTGCAEPVAKFTINGKPANEEPVGVKPGDTVTFNAASSELLGGFRKELIWKFGDGSEKVVIQPKEDEEASATTTHVYASAAKVTVKLELKLSKPPYGDPGPVERSFTVGTPPAGPELTITKAGSGSGTVTSSPAGINCGATCEAEFETGKEVDLTPTADSGSKFVKWTGACAGSGSCKVTMSAAKSVGAEFAEIPKFDLTVNKSGAGSGIVTSSPAGINCGTTCEAEFEEGQEVELSPGPATGSKFVKWTGACTGSGSCKVTMSAAKSVGAEYAIEQHQLNVGKSGTGTGTVTSSPVGIDCGATCQASFNHGTEVTLTAAAGVGSEFKGWSGACTGTGTCKVTLNDAGSVGAEFALEQHQLTVSKSGTGTGTVTSSPAGIDCGATCQANFNHGTEVTLTPAAGAGSEFKGWTGACTGTGSCKVTLSTAKSVTAEFGLIPGQKLLKVKKEGTGTGTVTSSPAGVSCGSTCEAAFTDGASVTLTATPGANSKAVVWGGCDEVVAGACKVTMSAAKEITATFALEQRQLTVKKSGSGSGTVSSAPGGISCGATCQASFNHGTEVTLTAAAGADSEFKGWSGACTGTGACKVTLSAAKEVSAEFATTPVTPPPPPEPPTPPAPPVVPPTEPPPVKPPTAAEKLAKALKKCKKLKGKAKATCTKKAKAKAKASAKREQLQGWGLGHWGQWRRR
ncbi:MAG TPA: hypothetical protein VFI03_11045, partial [Solirubrobacterales bacterium]|nr:hypothetical protein [Solirubrobacterales bacterium]